MQNKKIIVWIIAAALFIGGLVITLLPCKKRGPSGAYAENLWSYGQWVNKNPDSPWGEWIRREHGILWNWFIMDKDTTSDAWQARLDFFCLAFYVSIAFVLPAAFLGITYFVHSKTRQKNGRVVPGVKLLRFFSC